MVVVVALVGGAGVDSEMMITMTMGGSRCPE